MHGKWVYREAATQVGHTHTHTEKRQSFWKGTVENNLQVFGLTEDKEKGTRPSFLSSFLK